MDDLTLKLSSPPAKRVCSFATWFDQLADAEKESVEAALANPQWSTAKLIEVFKEHGATFDRHTLSKHREDKCVTCGPI